MRTRLPGHRNERLAKEQSEGAEKEGGGEVGGGGEVIRRHKDGVVTAREDE